jgi:hypothetical protein
MHRRAADVGTLEATEGLIVARDPEQLVEIETGLPDVSGSVLIHVLDGFVDAGAAATTAREHLLAGAETTLVATFDADQLVDYRARRPLMRFDHDHWGHYEAPELIVRLLHDDDAVPYLLLSGPEPDVMWEAFAEAVQLVVERLGVRLTVGLNAFPLGVPHTRPARAILHGSRPELFSGYEPWLGQMLVPASAGHLLEYRLGQAGHDTLGIAMPVPAYLAQAAYPAAAAELVRETGARAGLSLPVAGLDEAAAEARTRFDTQIAESDEAAEVVRALETQYDAYTRGKEQSLLAEAALPTADELGAELERFLAEQPRGDT